MTVVSKLKTRSTFGSWKMALCQTRTRFDAIAETVNVPNLRPNIVESEEKKQSSDGSRNPELGYRGDRRGCSGCCQVKWE